MAGLTKQQEIIVGVGVLVLLGYFAFGQQSTEKPLESAQGPSSGDDPATKEISAAIEFVKVQKEQQQAGQQMTSEVNARYNRFSQLFNEYAVLRQQVGNAMNTRTDQVRSRSKGGALNIYPLPDHLKAEIETLRRMCHTLQSESSGQFGILSLPLNDFQRRMVATTLEILTNHDLRLYEMALGNHLDAERDREAQQLVSWTQAVNNSQRYYTLNQQWINIQVQQPDVEMVDPPKKKKKIVGKGDASHLDRITGMKPQDGLFNQDTAPTAAVDAGNNQTDRATATRNRAVGAVQAAIVGGSRGASASAIAALPEFKYVPPRPATVIDDSQPFLLLGKTAPLPAQPNNLSLVKQTTDPANAAFNQAGGQNPHLSTALTTTNERTVDLTNIGDPAPKAQIAQVRVPTVEGNQVALIPNLQSAFQTIQPRPMLLLTNGEGGVTSTALVVRQIPVSEGTKRAASPDAFEGVFEEAEGNKRPMNEDPSEVERTTGTAGDSGEMFLSAPKGTRTTKEKAPGQSSIVAKVDPVYMSRINAINALASKAIIFLSDPNVSQGGAVQAVVALFEFYEKMLETYPHGEDEGYATIYKPYPFASKEKVGGKIELKANYFQWALNSPQNPRGTLKARAQTWIKTHEGTVGGVKGYQALFDWVLGCPEYLVYAQYVNNTYKKLKVFAFQYIPGLPSGWDCEDKGPLEH